MQCRGRIDNRRTRRTFEQAWPRAQMHGKLAAFVTRRIGNEDRAGKIGAQRAARNRHIGGIGMHAIFHAGLYVTRQKRRREPAGKCEIPKLAAAHERSTHDLRGFRVARIVQIGLKIVLAVSLAGLESRPSTKFTSCASALEPAAISTGWIEAEFWISRKHARTLANQEIGGPTNHAAVTACAIGSPAGAIPSSPRNKSASAMRRLTRPGSTLPPA